MSRNHNNPFAIMDQRAQAHMDTVAANEAAQTADFAKQSAIDARYNSLEVRDFNDAAHAEVFGEGGVIETLESNPAINSNQASEAAESYKADVIDLVEEQGFDISQAKLVMDMRDADTEAKPTLIANYLKQGMSAVDAEAKADQTYAKKDAQRRNIIKQEGVFTADEYQKARKGENLYSESAPVTEAEPATETEPTPDPEPTPTPDSPAPVTSPDEAAAIVELAETEKPDDTGNKREAAIALIGEKLDAVAETAQKLGERVLAHEAKVIAHIESKKTAVSTEMPEVPDLEAQEAIIADRKARQDRSNIIGSFKVKDGTQYKVAMPTADERKAQQQRKIVAEALAKSSKNNTDADAGQAESATVENKEQKSDSDTGEGTVVLAPAKPVDNGDAQPRVRRQPTPAAEAQVRRGSIKGRKERSALKARVQREANENPFFASRLKNESDISSDEIVSLVTKKPTQIAKELKNIESDREYIAIVEQLSDLRFGYGKGNDAEKAAKAQFKQQALQARRVRKTAKPAGNIVRRALTRARS